MHPKTPYLGKRRATGLELNLPWEKAGYGTAKLECTLYNSLYPKYDISRYTLWSCDSKVGSGLERKKAKIGVNISVGRSLGFQLGNRKA